MSYVELMTVAERCEQATGPDRELDKAIACAMQDDEQARTGKCPPLRWSYYTASLDAAVSLQPENSWPEVFRRTTDKRWFARCPVGDHTWENKAVGATEALARCASALRARANLTL